MHSLLLLREIPSEAGLPVSLGLSPTGVGSIILQRPVVSAGPCGPFEAFHPASSESFYSAHREPWACAPESMARDLEPSY